MKDNSKPNLALHMISFCFVFVSFQYRYHFMPPPLLVQDGECLRRCFRRNRQRLVAAVVTADEGDRAGMQAREGHEARAPALRKQLNVVGVCPAHNGAPSHVHAEVTA